MYGESFSLDMDIKKPSLDILKQLDLGKDLIISIRLSFTKRNKNGTMFAPIAVSRHLDETICLWSYKTTESASF